MPFPDFSIEDGFDGPVCGLDEAGRGPLAGPVVAACVYIPPDLRAAEWMTHVTDSKKLSHIKLEMLYAAITENCAFGIAEIAPQEIDRINILQASLKAMEISFSSFLHMQESISAMAPGPSMDPGLRRDDGNGWHALIDGNRIPANLPCRASAIVKGDSKSKSIAAASILAKVTRDRIMRKLAAEFPHYGWDSNVGYPTEAHRNAISLYGITIHHRRSFEPVKGFLKEENKHLKLGRL